MWGGMAKALRTIPVLLKVAQDMSELAPDALLVNFTNPAGLVTEALARHAPEVQSVGVCNAPLNAIMSTLRLLGLEDVALNRVHLDTLGLNHLTWHRGFQVDEEELWPQVLEKTIAHLQTTDKPMWDVPTIEALQMVPNYYLQYYYYPDNKMADQAKWPPSRAEVVMEIEDKLLAQYGEPDCSEPPPGLMDRGGAYYSTVATQLLNAHYNDLGETHVVNVPHAGAVTGWPNDWVLELPCRVDNAGIHPLPTSPLPPACFGLLTQVKMYEQLTVSAAVTGDRDLAFQALLAHPLGPSAHKVEAVLNDLLETHKAHLPQFWPDSG